MSQNIWWKDEPIERFWLEVRKVPGIGESLYCPTKNAKGNTDSSYELLRHVLPGDVIFHWNVKEQFFCGYSYAASKAKEKNGKLSVKLKKFQRFPIVVTRDHILRKKIEIEHDLQVIKAHANGATYCPIIIQNSMPQMRSNYFGKFPARLVDTLFGAEVAKSLIDETAYEVIAKIHGIKTLSAFEQKSDAEYISTIQSGVRYCTRKHETLVNECAHWLECKGYQPLRSLFVDLAVMKKTTVIIEAKLIKKENPSNAVREAIGQLHEYRYFNHQYAGMIMLTSKKLSPEWVRYLENDQKIGVIWPAKQGEFELSNLAARLLADYK